MSKALRVCGECGHKPAKSLHSVCHRTLVLQWGALRIPHRSTDAYPIPDPACSSRWTDDEDVMYSEPRACKHINFRLSGCCSLSPHHHPPLLSHPPTSLTMNVNMSSHIASAPTPRIDVHPPPQTFCGVPDSTSEDSFYVNDSPTDLNPGGSVTMNVNVSSHIASPPTPRITVHPPGALNVCEVPDSVSTASSDANDLPSVRDAGACASANYPQPASVNRNLLTPAYNCSESGSPTSSVDNLGKLLM